MLVKLSINQILGYLFETTITPYKKKNKLWRLTQNQQNVKW